MKNKKLLMSILAPCAILVPTASAVAITSCSNQSGLVTKEVDTFYDLVTALSDRYIDQIKLTKNIDIPLTSGDTGILINRSVIINGNGKSINWVSTTNLTPQVALIRIKNPAKSEARLAVYFKDLSISFSSKAQYNSVVCIDDAENSVINFDHTKVFSEYDTGAYNMSYALRIKSNIKKGCTINIKNSSKFNGWGAIYNTGSNVRLYAERSLFYGENHNAANDKFATITVSCYPIMEDHSFCANNRFGFYNCEIEANSAHPTDDKHQFVIQNRCPANNIVDLDSATIAGSVGLNQGENDPWFAMALDDKADITDANIAHYLSLTNHVDMPSQITNAETYRAYYTKEKGNISHFCKNGEPLNNNTGHFHYYYLNNSRDWTELPQH